MALVIMAMKMEMRVVMMAGMMGVSVTLMLEVVVVGILTVTIDFIMVGMLE